MKLRSRNVAWLVELGINRIEKVRKTERARVAKEAAAEQQLNAPGSIHFLPSTLRKSQHQIFDLDFVKSDCQSHDESISQQDFRLSTLRVGCHIRKV